MAVEQTLSIIKPDGVQKNLIGEIYGRFLKAGVVIFAARMVHQSK
jgi:nucleoside-diphosphate kinase